MALRKNSVSALLVTFHISTLSRTLASLGLPSTSETVKGIPSGSTKSTGNSKVSWSTAKYWVVDGNVGGRLTKGTKQRNSIRDTLKLRLQNYHDDFVTVKVCNYANPTWLGFVHMYEHCVPVCASRVSIVSPLSHDFPRVPEVKTGFLYLYVSSCEFKPWTAKSKQVSCYVKPYKPWSREASIADWKKIIENPSQRSGQTRWRCTRQLLNLCCIYK